MLNITTLTFDKLSEDELTQALLTDIPGAETEHSFRRWLESTSLKTTRAKCLPSWGERRIVYENHVDHHHPPV